MTAQEPRNEAEVDAAFDALELAKRAKATQEHTPPPDPWLLFSDQRLTEEKREFDALAYAWEPGEKSEAKAYWQQGWLAAVSTLGMGDLLAAAEAVVEQVYAVGTAYITPSVRNQLRAAIAKARGEE